VSSAENQQERLIEFRGWVTGFVDGEGCFSVSFVRQRDRAGRKGLQSRVPDLAAVRRVANRRYDNHRENMAQFIVSRREDLVGRMIPFFRQHPLRSAKRQDFEPFAMCVDLISRGRRLTRQGRPRSLSSRRR
jgi:hypothetical protein